MGTIVQRTDAAPLVAALDRLETLARERDVLLALQACLGVLRLARVLERDAEIDRHRLATGRAAPLRASSVAHRLDAMASVIYAYDQVCWKSCGRCCCLRRLQLEPQLDSLPPGIAADMLDETKVALRWCLLWWLRMLRLVYGGAWRRRGSGWCSRQRAFHSQMHLRCCWRR